MNCVFCCRRCSSEEKEKEELFEKLEVDEELDEEESLSEEKCISWKNFLSLRWSLGFDDLLEWLCLGFFCFVLCFLLEGVMWAVGSEELFGIECW